MALSDSWYEALRVVTSNDGSVIELPVDAEILQSLSDLRVLVLHPVPVLSSLRTNRDPWP